MMKKLLYPIDLSVGSCPAIEQIVWISRQLGGELHILHVIEKLQYDEVNRNYTNTFKEKGYEDKRQIAAVQIASICEKCAEEKVSCTSISLAGDPTDKIIEYIEQQNIDIVLLSFNREKSNSQFAQLSAKIINRSNAMVVTVPDRIGRA